MIPLALLAAISATPATFDAAIARARAGDTVTLAPGAYGWSDVFDRRWSPAITIDARAATFDRLRIRRVTGLNVVGGRYANTEPNGLAVEIGASNKVTLTDGTYSSAFRGIAVGGSRQISITRPTLDGLRSDGINIVSSRVVTISDGVCANFKPQAGDHPDCIQGWSIKGQEPSSDITITGMTIRGKMQGIFFGNPENGGVDRLRVIGNDIASAYVNGIGLFDCRNCSVYDNVVASWPGATWPSMLRLKGGTVRVARNAVLVPPAGFITNRLSDPIDLAASPETFEVYDDAIASAVPEPASWATMIAGIGTIAAGLRRRRAAAGARA